MKEACIYSQFVILLKSCSVAAGLASRERLRMNLATAVRSYGGPVFTCSVGVALYPEEGDQLEDLLCVADRCLYMAKQADRDRILATPDIPPNGNAAMTNDAP